MDKVGFGVSAREQASDRLGLHTGTSGELGFGQLQLLATFVQQPDHGIDLVDSFACALVLRPVVRILESLGEIPLGTGAWLSHESQG